MTNGYVTGIVKLFVRFDGLILFVGALIAFAQTSQPWWLFAALLLVPDIFMIGYVVNTTLGAFLYNLGHSYFLPALVVGMGLINDSNVTVAVGIIWFAHVGMDRFAGYGLKYHTSFKHTHLGDLDK